MSHDLTRSAPTDLFLDGELFNQAWRAAKLFADSQLVPQHLRGSPGDCLIALGLARELGDSPLHVMQAIYFVSGKAGFSASYMIARANQSGVFTGRISWRTRGEGDGLQVQAFACLASTGEEITANTSMDMARAEGWTKNPKYRSMPEHMLRYRAATMLVRLYCPEVMHGYSTAAELRDIEAAETVAPARVLDLPSVRPSLLPDPGEVAPRPVVVETPEPEPVPEPPAPAPAPPAEDLAAVKAECADLEAKVGAANVAAIRDTGKGPTAGADVTAWKGRAANALAYRDALREAAQPPSESGDGMDW